ncbi:MAG: pyruvate carboxylase subunit B [Deltaproteobacteria bacterium]|nr:pyruvate carboxylase subunit B [Deltaproteobacteria bacterium]
MDVTLRDGHQSLFATRMRTEDMIPIAQEMDQVGFWAVEVWGGATFDTMHRFLDEDPWERPRILKKYIKKTPFAMLLRGQNLVGYRHYADDVVRAFVEKACEVGIDVFRVFDALNDLRNFQAAVEVIKKNGRHFQGAICFSLTEPKMGGPLYRLQYYLDKAKTLEDMGADSICIKDMAGMISPYDAYTLIKGLKETVQLPVHLHTHFTSGMADMCFIKAIEAGVDILDTCLAPFSMFSSHAAIEPLTVALRGTPRDPKLNLNRLIKLGEHLESIAPKYIDLLNRSRISPIDISVLKHQIPGGMISNLVNQLKESNALDRLEDVYAELPQTREDLGMPPLVTPTSQIIGVQAVLNVLFGRYKIITNQVKDLCFGLYGETPAEIKPEVRAKALKKYKGGQKPVTGRPGDYLESELDKVRAEAGDLIKTEEDLLTYALYPITGKEFLSKKYGKQVR